MERIKYLILIFLFILLPLNVLSASVSTEINTAFSTPSPTTPQNVSFKVCTRKFNQTSENLFYLTLASINANKFKIDEMQSKSGYILFSVANKQFLADVSKIDDKTSMLKITPCNNNYFFAPGIITNMFKYVELNLNNSIDKMN